MQKRVIGIMAALAVSVASVMADSQVSSVELAGVQTNLSAAIPASGWLDKIEITSSLGTTCDVVVATYDGTTAIDKFVLDRLTEGSAKVYRPRAKGTDTNATALTYSSLVTTGGTNAVQVVTVPYERIVIGGNVKFRAQGVGVAAGVTNSLKCVIYYEPLKK
jgi:hypothetical protein